MAEFGELEAAVMNHVWSADSALSVRDVLERLQQQRPIAYTTVMTVLERLFRKQMLTRVAVGRAYQYSAAISRADYAASLMTDALARTTDRGAALVGFADRVTLQEARQLISALEARTGRRGHP